MNSKLRRCAYSEAISISKPFVWIFGCTDTETVKKTSSYWKAIESYFCKQITQRKQTETARVLSGKLLVEKEKHTEPKQSN